MVVNVDYSAQKPYYIHDQNSQKRYPIYDHTLWGRIFLGTEGDKRIKSPEIYLILIVVD